MVNKKRSKITKYVNLTILLMTLVWPAGASAAPSSFSLLSARERGVFNIGPAEGNLSRTFDESVKKEILKFEYSAPKGTVIGIWTKNFPTELTATQVNTVKIGVMVADPEQAHQITVAIEIKGTKDIQNIPLRLKPGWNTIQKSINWKLIGNLKEVVFVVSPMGGVESAAGMLYLDFDFVKLKSSPTSSFSLLDARKRGVFNIGQSEGRLSLTFDESVKKEVLKFEYSVPKETVVGVWTQAFPTELTATQVNTVNIGVMVADSEQAHQITVAIEIKGTKDVQNIPLYLRPGWNIIQKSIDWELIGDLKETVFVVSPMGGVESANGTLYLDLDFVRLKSSPTSSFSFLDARKRGVFNIGQSEGCLSLTFDESVKKEVLKFEYSAPKGTVVGVWTQDFLSGLGANSVNMVKIGVKMPHDQLYQVTVAVEIKGTKDVQNIPLRLKPGWNTIQESIDWEMIGDLKEAVFVVTPMGGIESANGTLYLDLDFVKLKSSEKSSAPVGALSSFSFLDARKRGVFNIGQSEGCLSLTFDESVKKEVLKFEYSAPKGTIVGVWTQAFPSELGAISVNTVNIGVKMPHDQLYQVSVKVEIKGTKNVQNIPLRLKPGWNTIQESIDWEMIGDLKEAVFVVSPMGGVESANGTLYLELDFVKLKSSEKSSASAGVPSSFGLMGARGRGVFNIGQAEGNLSCVFDETIEKDVLKFDYTVPVGTLIGVWTKNFPPELGAVTANAINIGVKVSGHEQVNQVAVKLEIKGTKDKQNILIRLGPGWNSIKEAIHWNKIGELSEVVFVVSPRGIGEPKAGTLYFDFHFGKLKFSETAGGKVGLVLATGFLMALIWAFFGRLFGRRGADRQLDAGVKFRDLIYGIAAVLIAGVAFIIYTLGPSLPAMSSQDVVLRFLSVGLMGAVIAQLLKSGLTGKHLTPGEVFQNILLTGLLAASSSPQVLLQAPASWAQVFMKSNLIAALAFLIYQVSNACSLSSKGKHLRAITGSLIVGTPYLFGWLLLLENVNLLQTLSNGITGGILSAWPAILEVMGRLIIVFSFNEAVINGISLATKGKTLKTPGAHLFTLFVSLSVVLSPYIANLGSTAAVASMPRAIGTIVALLTTIFSHAGLWGEVYLITGMTLDGTHGIAPTRETISNHVIAGMRKGMAYSGILMAILYVLNILLDAPMSQILMTALPMMVGIFSGALVFPLVKTIIETFDGSQAFLSRMRYSYRNWTLYVRGAVAGFGLSYMITQGLFQQNMPDRIKFGLLIGLIASVGVSILRDAVYAFRGRGKIQSWRLYFIDALLGSFVGSAAAFYLDSSQVPVIIEKFKLYTSSGFSAVKYTTYPLVNKWGRIDLGTYTGGVKLLFTESLSGVINWSVAAWLFAINRAFMEAFFQKDKTPIKFLFSKAGAVELIKHMIQVLRWGLWMAPIIFTFLRMMPDPTWYNQDGAVRTLFAIYHNVTMDPSSFQAWSLKIFVWLLACDFFRVLIWMDHMGLRVATLVNLSFIGMNKLDERIARFIGPAAAQRYIPEAVKRFATWAPLLLPFYLPRGQAWDYAWTTSEAMQSAAGGWGILAALQSLTLPGKLLLIGFSILTCTVISIAIRTLRRRSRQKSEKTYELHNRVYKVSLKENGGGHSELFHNGCDVTRRSYDTIDPCGRVLHIVDASELPESLNRSWPILGNFPKNRFKDSFVGKEEDCLKFIKEKNDIKTSINVSLPDEDSPAEIWTVNIENLTDKPRDIKIIPYLEWVLNKAADDRFHPQYSRLFPEMEYVSSVNAILAWQKNTKSMGILSADIAPEGFLTSRMDFIGRARSIWTPRILETLDFLDAVDTAAYPTFDSIGSFMLGVQVDPKASKTIRLMIGYADNRQSAIDLINKYLKPQAAKTASSSKKKKKSLLIGHGEIPPGIPQPYSEYIDNGNKLLVHTPYTPRPYDHAMSNAVGHSVMVTNRGLHTSCNGNSQQNRLTPDCPDTVTREVPGEAVYLYDIDRKEWYSPTHQPLNDYNAKNEAEFCVDGTAVFRMTKGTISTELKVFVPIADPLGIYLLTVKNNDIKPRRMRIAPYFQIVLAFQPEMSGPLKMRYDKVLDALFFENPRNTFRSGTAFASMSIPSELVETKRGRFFGSGRGTSFPFMVEKGESDVTQVTDVRPIAGFLGTMEIPARGKCTIAVILGQTDNSKQAARLVQKYKNIEVVSESLKSTRKWWLSLMGTVDVQTNNQEFDQFQNWLKYQSIAERIWARRGFYQTSGAFGFRDQLQDTVNLIWVDPSMARKQILLHASQQFIEGDVFHWFFTLTDGRTAFAYRSHASDNLLWLVWGVVEYIRATGDDSILDEMTSYVVSENPFQPLPENKQGWGDLYHRSTRADSVYRHCIKSLDTVLEKRMGKHKLPLIQTGDWNDGLDDIGSEGRGESVWLGFFLYYILKDMVGIIEKKEGSSRKEHYLKKLEELSSALELTWRDDRYLRAIHDDGTEIGVKDSGIWEIDALTAAWAVMSGINPERGLTVFNTALSVLERENVVLLGWPALREDTIPYLGRSCKYPEGVRENGMYCHGVQWLIKAARILVEQFEKQGASAKANEYREIAYRLWLKITPISHVTPGEIEIYGGQPNKQPADILTTFDQGRMIWNGYTGAAGWLFREALEGVVGASLVNNELVLPADIDKPRGELKISRVSRDVTTSPLKDILAGHKRR